MDSGVDVVALDPSGDPAPVLDALRRGAGRVLVHRPEVEVGRSIVDALTAALGAPMAATASPVPLADGPRTAVGDVPRSDLLPPAPTLSGPCTEVCLISGDAVASVASVDTGGAATWADLLERLAARLVAAGWRHVGAPHTCFAWTPGGDPVDGPANESLQTHRLWAATRRRPARVVVDGACLSDDPHNGSQAVVWNVARALARTRPDASVTLAVPEAHLTHLRALAAASGVHVVARDAHATGFDLVYRPYQPLDPGELGWLTGAGARLLTSQLDVIAFANPTYHPSSALFHAVRNLQRHALRMADGVTFISEFGRQATLAECPDLDVTRTFVVSCGADAEPPDDPAPSAHVAARLTGRFIVCTSATFSHKNRQHAIRVFGALCREHGYAGSLVIAGPEPYYGRSADADRQALAALDPDVAARVVELGRVDAATKWWLLAHADVVLYPSVVEGFGLVPFEAAAVATPSLAFAGSALAEVLGGTPAVVDSWDADIWARRAAELVDDPAAAERVVAAVRRVGGAHTWDAVAERTWEAIDNLLARPRAARFAEEGGLASRIAGNPGPVAPGARAAHFVNRLRSYAERRFGR